MGQQVVTELVIDSDTAGADRFSQSMDKAGGSAKDATSSAAGMTLAIAGVGVAVIGAIAGLRSFIDYVGNQTQALVDMDEHAKLAGFSMKEFQETLFAARAKGLTEKDFVSGLDKVAADLTAAGRGVTEFGRLFEANGLSIKNSNGELKNTKAALADISGLMQNASPQVQQAVAKIVGLSASWVPFLRQGVEGIEAQKKAAADLGVIIDDDMINKAKDFNAQWKTAVATWDLQFKASLASILPLLVQLANIASTVIEGIGSISSTLSRHMTPDDDKSKSQLNDQINQVAQLRDMMASLNDQSGEFKKFKVNRLASLLGLGDEASLKDVDVLLDKLTALYDKKPTSITVGAVGSTVLPPANDNKDALDRQIEAIDRHIAKMKADTESVGQNVGAQEQLRAEAALYEAAQRAGKTDLEQYADQFFNLSQKAGDAALALEKAKVASQIDFANKTKFLSADDVAIANQLKGIYGNDVPASLASSEAAAIRFNNQLKSINETVRDGAKSFAKDFVQGLVSGKSGMEALTAAASALGQKLTSAGIDNIFKDPTSIVGYVEATIGVITQLASGKSAAQQKAEKELEAAKVAWANMATQVVAFNAAAKGFDLGPLTQQLSSLFSTTVQLQQAAQKAQDRAGETSAANNFNQAVERIGNEFVRGAVVLTPAAQAIKDLNNEASGLSETLRSIGQAGTANKVDAALQGRMDALTSQLTSSLTDSLTRDINSSKGVSYLNDIADAISALTKNLADASALSSSSLADLSQQDFTAKVQSIVDGAQITGDAFTSLDSQFGLLQRGVHAFTQSAVTDAKALQDAQNSAAKSVTDYLNNLTAGPGSTLSPQATLANAQALYNSNLALAQGGNADAQAKFASLADNLEKAARANFASGAGYQDIRNQIINQGLALPAVQATTDPVTQAVRDAITAIQIGNAALGAANTLTTNAVLPAVNAGNAANVAAALSTYFNQIDPTGQLYGIIANTFYAQDNAAKINTTAGLINNNAANTKAAVDSNNTLTGTSNTTLDAIKGLQTTSSQNLALMQSALAPGAIQVSIAGGAAQTVNNLMVAALNKIVVNTYMTALNTNLMPKQAGGGIGVLAAGGWITGGIPGRDSVPLASGNALGMPGEFVVRHDIAQMNRSWLPDFNATGRLPFNDNAARSFVSPNVVPFNRGSGGNAELLAEVRRLNEKIDRLERVVAGSGANVARAVIEGADKVAGKVDDQTGKLASNDRNLARQRKVANG